MIDTRNELLVRDYYEKHNFDISDFDIRFEVWQGENTGEGQAINVIQELHRLAAEVSLVPMISSLEARVLPTSRQKF